MSLFSKIPLIAWMVFALTAAPSAGRAADRFDDPLKIDEEEGPVDPILAKHYTPAWRACQQKSAITSDNIACFAAEFNRQNQTLNQTWHQVFARTVGADHARLLAAQRQWLAARDPFCSKAAEHFAGGSIIPIVYEDCRVELTIRRVLWLERFR